jgi:hypothetical protein
VIVDTASNDSVKGRFKWELLKQPKLAEVDGVLRTYFTAMCSGGKPMTGPIINDKVRSFYDAIKITNKRTFPEGWLQNLGAV